MREVALKRANSLFCLLVSQYNLLCVIGNFCFIDAAAPFIYVCSFLSLFLYLLASSWTAVTVMFVSRHTEMQSVQQLAA